VVKLWRRQLYCHCQAAGYPLCHRVPPLSRTTGLHWGCRRSSSSSLFSVPSSRYASGPSFSSRTIPSTSALTWAWRTCSSLILTHPRRASMLRARRSYMEKEDLMNTDTGKHREMKCYLVIQTNCCHILSWFFILISGGNHICSVWFWFIADGASLACISSRLSKQGYWCCFLQSAVTTLVR